MHASMLNYHTQSDTDHLHWVHNKKLECKILLNQINIHVGKEIFIP